MAPREQLCGEGVETVVAVVAAAISCVLLLTLTLLLYRYENGDILYIPDTTSTNNFEVIHWTIYA